MGSGSPGMGDVSLVATLRVARGVSRQRQLAPTSPPQYPSPSLFHQAHRLIYAEAGVSPSLALLGSQRPSAQSGTVTSYALHQEAFDRTLKLYLDFAKEIRRISEQRTTRDAAEDVS